MPILPILRPTLPPSAQPFFDLDRGLRQMLDTPTVLWSGVAIAISISLFNFFGLSVTRHVSATARSLTDACRTLSIWIISLGLGWERLIWPISLLQVTGFALLVYVPYDSPSLLDIDDATDTARSCLTIWSTLPSSCVLTLPSQGILTSDVRSWSMRPSTRQPRSLPISDRAVTMSCPLTAIIITVLLWPKASVNVLAPELTRRIAFRCHVLVFRCCLRQAFGIFGLVCYINCIIFIHSPGTQPGVTFNYGL